MGAIGRRAADKDRMTQPTQGSIIITATMLSCSDNQLTQENICAMLDPTVREYFIARRAALIGELRAIEKLLGMKQSLPNRV